MSTLTENALRSIEKAMLDLSGDEDFLPFMTIKDRKGDVALVGMVMGDSPEEKDQLADMMTALCMVHGGVEVTFAASSWMVIHNPDHPYRVDQPAPSKHPDRAEMAFLAVVELVGDDESRFTIHSAPIIRENNMVAAGLWTSNETAEKPEGRFAEAIHMGVQMGQKLPPDMREFFDTEAAEGRLEELVRRTAELISETRKSVFG